MNFYSEISNSSSQASDDSEDDFEDDVDDEDDDDEVIDKGMPALNGISNRNVPHSPSFSASSPSSASPSARPRGVTFQLPAS